MDDLEEIIRGNSTVLFAARIDGVIVGLLTLATFRIPTGVRAWIEDVVVDDLARGKGVGKHSTVPPWLKHDNAVPKPLISLLARAVKQPTACINALDLYDVTPTYIATNYDRPHGVS